MTTTLKVPFYKKKCRCCGCYFLVYDGLQAYCERCRRSRRCYGTAFMDDSFFD